MSKREFDTLKVGDLVTPKRGKNKGMHAVVTHIWESGIKVDGYRENRITCVYLDPPLHEPNHFECSSWQLKRIYV